MLLFDEVLFKILAVLLSFYELRGAAKNQSYDWKKI